ncbi:hypothetical protein GIB67_005022 [Kingdonia uniflora]|uniref:Sugar phosphate transporter domain-containing protein n=1 Tax=Kingdonia uniflora TaxID=39325 RepID=A0A7J7NN69_9MAGN|nr:hypothetical protein GIB67_005022 [Kingdonia uniflora]
MKLQDDKIGRKGYLSVATVLVAILSLAIVHTMAILPMAIVHTMGNLFTNMSLGKVVISFTHTIKAIEPFFSILLSAMFLGEVRSFFLPFYFHYLDQL